MQAPSRKLEWMVWSILGLIIASLLLAFILAHLRLRLVRAGNLPVLGQVQDFSLTNQLGRRVSLADLRGHPWVADIIFTRCPGPCLKMTRQLHELQDALAGEKSLRLVSLTTDPDYDSPAVLKTYAEKNGADPGRWLFLTGTKKEIANLAIHSLKLTAIEKKPEERESPNDLFIHSTIFVLVDKQARLRGVFETTGEGVDFSRARRQIVAGARRLEQER